MLFHVSVGVLKANWYLWQGYLRRFYQLRTSSSSRHQSRNRRDTSAMVDKIKEMQGFFGLEQTGTLDPQTLAVMRRDRCGVPDVENFSVYPKRTKWRNKTITYRYPFNLNGML